MDDDQRGGPLTGYRIIEVAGLGPGPFACMLLSDMGADVIRVDRPESTELADYNSAEEWSYVNRGRSSIALDLKSEPGQARFLEMVAAADGLVEGFRPGVMERLGIGPKECQAVNPGLVFVRLTGWGQDGPLAHQAGHDANYVALSGLLGLLGGAGQPPSLPLNLLGDYAAGGLMAVIGMVGGLLERSQSGVGQVVDTAIVDGSVLLTSWVHGQLQAGNWRARGTNFLDGGAPYYNVYATADDKFVAFGAIEEKFFLEFLAISGLDSEVFADRRNPERWEGMKQELVRFFRTRTRDEWGQVFLHTDACVTPVYDVDEVERVPHIRARGTIAESHGRLQPQPAPRFERTPSSVQGLPVLSGEGGAAALKRWGIDG